MEPTPAADRQADQEHRQNDREDVDREPEQHAQQARPHHLRAQRRRAGNSDRRRRCVQRGMPSAPGLSSRVTRRAVPVSLRVARCGVRAASAKLPSAIARLIAAATYVAIAML